MIKYLADVDPCWIPTQPCRNVSEPARMSSSGWPRGYLINRHQPRRRQPDRRFGDVRARDRLNQQPPFQRGGVVKARYYIGNFIGGGPAGGQKNLNLAAALLPWV